MNVALTDHLVCPRCGPPFGLILLAHDVRDRRVHEGEFGCPNCRDRFPVEGGFGDLRPPPRGAGPGDAPSGGVGGASAPARDRGADAATRALKLAAALGVARGPGLMVVPDGCRAEAAPLAKLVAGIEVVVVGWGGRGMLADGVSAFVTGPRLPLRNGVVRGVVAEGGAGEGWWGECVRVLMPGGRVVIIGAGTAAHEWMTESELVTLLHEDDTLVGGIALPGAGPRPVNWRGQDPGPRV